MRIFFALLGVVVIVLQTSALGAPYSGLDSPVWGYLLGIGLIIAPFAAVGMLACYLLMIIALLGPAIAGLLIVKEVTESSELAYLGFIGGGVIGFKFVGSKTFDRLVEPIRRVAEKK